MYLTLLNMQNKIIKIHRTNFWSKSVPRNHNGANMLYPGVGKLLNFDIYMAPRCKNGTLNHGAKQSYVNSLLEAYTRCLAVPVSIVASLCAHIMLDKLRHVCLPCQQNMYLIPFTTVIKSWIFQSTFSLLAHWCLSLQVYTALFYLLPYFYIQVLIFKTQHRNPPLTKT